MHTSVKKSMILDHTGTKLHHPPPSTPALPGKPLLYFIVIIICTRKNHLFIYMYISQFTIYIHVSTLLFCVHFHLKLFSLHFPLKLLIPHHCHALHNYNVLIIPLHCFLHRFAACYKLMLTLASHEN